MRVPPPSTTAALLPRQRLAASPPQALQRWRCLAPVGYAPTIDLPDERPRLLRRHHKASHASREKIDTDGFDHPKKIHDLIAASIRRRHAGSDIEAVPDGSFRRPPGGIWT